MQGGSQTFYVVGRKSALRLGARKNLFKKAWRAKLNLRKLCIRADLTINLKFAQTISKQCLLKIVKSIVVDFRKLFNKCDFSKKNGT